METITIAQKIKRMESELAELKKQGFRSYSGVPEHKKIKTRINIL